jgi:hypothetical protein
MAPFYCFEGPQTYIVAPFLPPHDVHIPVQDVRRFTVLTVVPFLSYEIYCVTNSGARFLVEVVEPREEFVSDRRSFLREAAGTRRRARACGRAFTSTLEHFKARDVAVRNEYATGGA